MTTPQIVLTLIERVEKLSEVLEWYGKGGNPPQDVWLNEELGYFTGKRAKATLEKYGKDVEL